MNEQEFRTGKGPAFEKDNVASLTRAKAEKTGSAKDWTVADAIAFSGDLDNSDAEACAVIIAGKADENGERTYQYIFAGQDRLMKRGLISQALADLPND